MHECTCVHTYMHMHACTYTCTNRHAYADTQIHLHMHNAPSSDKIFLVGKKASMSENIVVEN